MKEKNPDDIMAECLLTGGKMLAKSCRACGSPLFEVKGETLCVVCREKGKKTGKAAAPPATPVLPAGTGQEGPGGTPEAGGSDEERELRLSIAVLARRAREETDPDRCRAITEAARNAALALSLLQR